MTGRAPRCLCVALLTALLAACSTPGTRVILLPQADGRPSAVAVRARDGEEILSAPYQRATAAVGATGAPRVDQADPAKVRAENRALFDLAPAAFLRYLVYFDAGGTVLTPESQQVMAEALMAALIRGGGDIVVTGHTDTTDTGPANDALSLRRAQQVREMFVARGFPAKRIEAVGRGKRELAVPTSDNVDEARNRRVIIEVR